MMVIPKSLLEIRTEVGDETFKVWDLEARFAARLNEGHLAPYHHAYEWSFIQKRYRGYRESMRDPTEPRE